MRTVQVTAFAKVNLCLEVLSKRPDGFHEVRSVLQSISLGDDLIVEEASELSLECDIPELAGKGNLAMRAARLLLERYARDDCARISIRKAIPIASGLGGASADAAAVLVALVALWGMKPQPSDLQIIAAELGSDVPFFLTGGAAIVRGRGHLVYPLPHSPALWVVLLVPPHDVVGKTAALYRRLTAEDWSTGEQAERLADAISGGRGVPPNLLQNVFEPAATSTFSSLPGYREAMLAAGCPSVHLSGAGPSLFSLFSTESEARTVAAGLESRGLRPLVAHTLSSPEAVPTPVLSSPSTP